MPELPEVETVRRGLEPQIVGRTIEKVTVRDRRLRWPVPRGLAKAAQGRRIRAVGRRGKYLILDLGGDRILLHLGMSGRVLLLAAGATARRHDHVDLLLSGGVLVRFHDPRRFGTVLWWPGTQAEHPLLRELGPEPFTPEFGGEYLFAESRGRAIAIKAFVMDAKVVVGVGNIYASEALFRAGIRPTRAAGRVTRAEYGRLAVAVREVLKDAIGHGGTTLRDFAGAHGDPGDFGVALRVYDRAGQKCLRCATPIRRIVSGQRATYFCPQCQK